MFTPFYHQLLRRYHISFGQLFANTILLRNENVMNDGDEAQRVGVPIEYSAREAWLARLKQDPSLTQRHSIVMPRFAFEMTGMRYDSSRKLNSLNTRTVSIRESGNWSLRRYFIPTPYILSFSLYAIARSEDDAQQITEQIVPYFQPDYTLLVRLIPAVSILDRMRITMDGQPQWADSYETASFDSTREILLTFNFSAHANFYGPIATTPSNIIRRVIVDLYSAGDETLNSVIYPMHIEANGFDLLLDEDGEYLLEEASTSAVGRVDRVARIDIEPDPVDAEPVLPVNVTITTTETIHPGLDVVKVSSDTVQ